MKLIIDIPEEEYKMRMLWAKSDNLCSPDTMLIAKGVPYEEKPEYFPPCEDCNKKMEEIRQAYDKMKSMETTQGEWIDYSEEGFVECPFCHKATNCEDNIDELHFCWNCGSKLRKGGAE